MPAEHDPSTVPGVLDGLIYIGGAVAAIVVGIAGYMRKPRPEVQQARVAGAIVDNAALQPLFQRFDTLINRLDDLIAALTRDVGLREKEAEDEAQQERVDQAVDRAMDRIMRENLPAPMPGIRQP